MRILLICLLPLFPLGTAAAQDLGAAFDSARAVTARFRDSAASIPAAPVSAASVQASGSFIPEGCSVESWCLVKATDCFLGQTTQPGGLWKAYAQYSVVRRAVALCPDGYGRWSRRALMGPVEPQVFSSGVETEEATASAAAMKLCALYRKDWVDAAPVCPAN